MAPGHRPLLGLLFLGIAQKCVVDPFAGELVVLPELGELRLVTSRLLARVFLPDDVRFGAQDTRTFPAIWQV